MAGTLTISTPDHNLVEAGFTDSVGVAQAAVTLTISGSDSYDLTGWTAQADGTYLRAATYGQVVLNTATNQLTYSLDNQRSAVQILKQGDTLTDPVTIKLTGGASAAAAFTLLGENDAPVITASSGSASGHLNVTDADRSSTVLLSVQGGTTSSVPQSFHDTMASFSITKNGAAFFSDNFADGNPPPSAPNFANGSSASYSSTGTATEAGNRLVLDSAQGAYVGGIGTTQPISGIVEKLLTNADDASADGLKKSASFVVNGVFDFTLPAHPREVYGIRLDDATSTHVGNNLVELDVRQDTNGVNHVDLRGLDTVSNSTVTLAESAALTSVSPGDQIALHLSHDATAADPTTIKASYEIIHNGVTGPTLTLGNASTHIFDGENFTRAGINAYARVDTLSQLTGQYGTLSINQNADYTYTPNAAASALAAGSTVRDPFTIVATDEHGATATKAITVQVAGSSTGTPTTSLATDSRLVDGYIAGATVFADANGNGVLDPGEASTQTDATGTYSLSGGSGPLVATGGTDVSTGLPLGFTLTAPAGSTVISPLTTLVQALGGTADAQGKVAAAFGLSSNTNLLSLDPVAATQASATDGSGAYLAGIAVNNAVSLISAGLTGQGADSHAAGAAVFSALATKIGTLGQGAALNLTDTSLVTGTIADASTHLGITSDSTTIAALAKLVSGSTADLTSAAGQSSGQALIDAASAKATVVQGTLSQAVQQAHGSADAIQNVVDGFGPTAEHLNPVYRFYDPKTGDHMYTSDAFEAGQITANLSNFKSEGAPWEMPDKGPNTVDVFRFYDTTSHTHLFTTSTVERDSILTNLHNFNYEGVAFQAYASAQNGNEYALERFYNTSSGSHHLAADASEVAGIRAGAAGPGWVDEGASFVVHAPVHDLLSP